ncbi:MAG: DUF4178 domain-containing protein [Pseudomonadota bacterium]
MSDAQTKTLNCTQCGAGLSVYGGGRVKVHVCSYCGAALDAQADFKVLARYADLPRPDSPFELGRKGRINGVMFTVIGTIGWREIYGGKAWTWVDHQVYSPTHGYAWLTWEDGHVVFTRKVRGRALPPWLTPRFIETTEFRPEVVFEGLQYTYYSSGQPRPSFIEGEFNYVPALDDRPGYVTFAGRDGVFRMVGKDQEREYERSIHLPRDRTLRAFGALPKKWGRAKGVHITQPFERGPLAGFARNALLAGAAAALIMALLFRSFGTVIARQSLEIGEQVQRIPFVVSRDAGLLQIDVTTNVRNGWVWFEGDVLNAAGETVAAFEDGAQYYTGREGGERWTEGRRKMRVRANVPAAAYTLEIAMPENVGDARWSGQPASSAGVVIIEGVAAVSWLVYAALGLAAGGLAFLMQRWVHDGRRWQGSDWSDEE